MTQNPQFKRLLDEGIRSVAARQGKSLEGVETELAEKTEYSRATIHHWRRGHPPPNPKSLEQIVEYCVRYGRLNAVWTRNLLIQGGHPQPDRLLARLFNESETKSKHIFMCYARGSEPDQTIALAIAQELSPDYIVFFDQAAAVDGWAEKIERELAQCNYLILLLSNESITNEVVLLEMEIVWRLYLEGGKPRFLPVKLNQTVPLPAPLHIYLEGVNWIVWQEPDNIASLIEQVKHSLADGRFSPHPARPIQPQPVTVQPTIPQPLPRARPYRLEMPEGTIDLESRFYVRRASDQIALEAITYDGVTMTIKGPRQMGKSSLLIRVAEAAKERGKKVVFLDFQLLQASLQDAELFFRHFCTIMSFQLGLSDETEQYWNAPITNAFRCTHYVLQEILRRLNQPVMLAMDEVESIFDTPFRTDFFAMLRSWHNNRARDASWKQLDLALVTSTEPYYFVQSLSQSPFNVGEIIDLPAFTLEQAAALNKLHLSPFTQTALQELMNLLRGHPYLVRRALYLVASDRISASDLLAQPTDAYGPFGDHLRSLLLRLHHNQTMLHSLQQVLQTGHCPDELFFRLHGAGLIKRENGRIVPYCPLYAHFFQQQLSHAQI